MGELYKDGETPGGRPVPSRVTVDGRPGLLWGLGYDPKGVLCMVDLDDGERLTLHEADLDDG